MIMRIKIGNNIKIYKCWNRIKSAQVKAIHICLKGINVEKAMFYWNTKTKYKKKIKQKKNK